MGAERGVRRRRRKDSGTHVVDKQQPQKGAAGASYPHDQEEESHGWIPSENRRDDRGRDPTPSRLRNRCRSHGS